MAEGQRGCGALVLAGLRRRWVLVVLGWRGQTPGHPLELMAEGRPVTPYGGNERGR